VGSLISKGWREKTAKTILSTTKINSNLRRIICSIQTLKAVLNLYAKYNLLALSLYYKKYLYNPLIVEKMF